MALSDRRILEEIENGNIIIDPFTKEDLSTSSYDLRLGEYYYREQGITSPRHRSKIFNPYSKKDTFAVWGEVQKAKPLRETLGAARMGWDEEEEGISLDNEIILIGPGETILAHTLEYIGGLVSTTTSMQTRSSHGRSFIGVCKCAGWGDVGYINRWTMEITNFSRFRTIPLVVGRRYAQMVFSETGLILNKNYGTGGKYQTGSDLEIIKKNWKPEMMLPKLYLDRDRKKI